MVHFCTLLRVKGRLGRKYGALLHVTSREGVPSSKVTRVSGFLCIARWSGLRGEVSKAPRPNGNTTPRAQPSDFRSRTGTQLPGVGSALRHSFPNGNTTPRGRLSPPTFVPEREHTSQGSAQPSDFRSRTGTQLSGVGSALRLSFPDSEPAPPLVSTGTPTCMGGLLPLNAPSGYRTAPSLSMPNPEIGRSISAGAHDQPTDRTKPPGTTCVKSKARPSGHTPSASSLGHGVTAPVGIGTRG